MIRIILSLILLFMTINVYAAGWANLQGTNKVGQTIVIFPAWDDSPSTFRDYSIPENREYFNIYIDNGEGLEKAVKYIDQRCKYKNDNVGQPIEFSCVAGTKSPLSGVTYKIEPNRGDDFWSYESEYICITGCQEGKSTPDRLYKSHWEGEEAECQVFNQQIAITKKKINVRDKPSIKASIIGKVYQNQKVDILTRDKICRTYPIDDELLDGYWVKVKISDTNSEFSGWVFEGVLQYSE